MSEENLYQPPSADLNREVEGGELTITGPHTRGVGNGATWLLNGWGFFKSSALAWIGAIVIYVVIAMVASLIPLIGQLAMQLVGPVFMAGFMLGCREQEAGNDFTIGHMFAGFQNKFGSLVVLALLYLVALVVAVVIGTVIMGILFGGMGAFGDPETMGHVGPVTVLLAVLIFMALVIPVAATIWFSPALVMLNDIPPVEAMKMSVIGVLKNIVPFIVYGLLGMVLGILALIPLGLGMLVLLPMFMASIYIGYRDIFTDGPATAG
jgi:uncharacterized membrane protein